MQWGHLGKAGISSGAQGTGGAGEAGAVGSHSSWLSLTCIWHPQVLFYCVPASLCAPPPSLGENISFLLLSSQVKPPRGERGLGVFTILLLSSANLIVAQLETFLWLEELVVGV